MSRFYLSFENSFCQSYVSEKYFKLFENVDVIPVVRGGLDYKRYLARGSFIDASDFQSAQDLARYLLYLSKHRKRYTRMLELKDRWTAHNVEPFHCRMCERLHTDLSPGHFTNLKEALQPDGECWPPDDLGDAGPGTT
ncbi:alpha-(1,3)-fucosyltransferase C [Aplysia californica]|uniref:Fucosyltransferase n=1 Tax=Aplysia californica TaxID=6500 RepID=A0ABM0ZYH3_APLCA|nr:alpha-(1,3)-fucosyltransferase C [Aplysia californica]